MDELLELRSPLQSDYPRGALTTLALPDVEVVTLPRDPFSGQIISTINGGQLDGQHFQAPEGLSQRSQHRWAVRFVRGARIV